MFRPPLFASMNFGRQQVCVAYAAGVISLESEHYHRIVRHADHDCGSYAMSSPSIPLGLRCNELYKKAQNIRQAIPSCQAMLTSGEYMGYGRWRNEHPLMWSRHTTIHPRRRQESTRIMTMLLRSSETTTRAYIKSTANRLCGPG